MTSSCSSYDLLYSSGASLRRVGPTMSINELFDDLLLSKIFAFLLNVRPKSYPTLSRVCFRWYAILRDHRMFKSTISLFQESHELNQTVVEKYQDYYKSLFTPCTTSVSFRHCLQLSGTTILELISKTTNIVELDLSNCWNVGPQFFNSVRLPNLRVLRLANIRLPMEKMISPLIEHSPHLSELVVSGCLYFKD